MTLSASDVEVGQTFTQVVVDDLTRTQIVQYAGASGDYNPIHTDDLFATKVAGYPGVFAHGMLTMGATAKLITDTVGDGALTEYGVRFLNQVWPGRHPYGHSRDHRRPPRRWAGRPIGGNRQPGRHHRP